MTNHPHAAWNYTRSRLDTPHNPTLRIVPSTSWLQLPIYPTILYSTLLPSQHHAAPLSATPRHPYHTLYLTCGRSSLSSLRSGPP